MTDPLEHRTRCVLGKPDEPHHAALGLLVCDGHREKLYEQLRAIVDTLARIAVRATATGQGSSGPSGTLASQRSVLDVESLALAGPFAPGEITAEGLAQDGWDEHHPHAVVGLWARLVREERQLDPPAGPATLTVDVDLLVRQLDWCCAQPWVDDMAREIGDSLARVQRADPERVRPGDEGRCPAVGLGPDGSCGGQLRRERGAVPWLIRPDRCERVPVDVHAGVVRCQRCGATWATERDEANLKLMRERQAREALRPHTEDGRPMLTADELAEELGIARATVAVRAYRAGHQAERGHYDPGVIARATRASA